MEPVTHRGSESSAAGADRKLMPPGVTHQEGSAWLGGQDRDRRRGHEAAGHALGYDYDDEDAMLVRLAAQ